MSTEPHAYVSYIDGDKEVVPLSFIYNLSADDWRDKSKVDKSGQQPQWDSNKLYKVFWSSNDNDSPEEMCKILPSKDHIPVFEKGSAMERAGYYRAAIVMVKDCSKEELSNHLDYTNKRITFKNKKYMDGSFDEALSALNNKTSSGKTTSSTKNAKGTSGNKDENETSRSRAKDENETSSSRAKDATSKDATSKDAKKSSSTKKPKLTSSSKGTKGPSSTKDTKSDTLSKNSAKGTSSSIASSNGKQQFKVKRGINKDATSANTVQLKSELVQRFPFLSKISESSASGKTLPNDDPDVLTPKLSMTKKVKSGEADSENDMIEKTVNTAADDSEQSTLTASLDIGPNDVVEARSSGNTSSGDAKRDQDQQAAATYPAEPSKIALRSSRTTTKRPLYVVSSDESEDDPPKKTKKDYWGDRGDSGSVDDTDDDSYLPTKDWKLKCQELQDALEEKKVVLERLRNLNMKLQESFLEKYNECIELEKKVASLEAGKMKLFSSPKEDSSSINTKAIIKSDQLKKPTGAAARIKTSASRDKIQIIPPHDDNRTVLKHGESSDPSSSFHLEGNNDGDDTFEQVVSPREICAAELSLSSPPSHDFNEDSYKNEEDEDREKENENDDCQSQSNVQIPVQYNPLIVLTAEQRKAITSIGPGDKKDLRFIKDLVMAAYGTETVANCTIKGTTKGGRKKKEGETKQAPKPALDNKILEAIKGELNKRVASEEGLSLENTKWDEHKRTSRSRFNEAVRGAIKRARELVSPRSKIFKKDSALMKLGPSRFKLSGRLKHEQEN